MKKQLILSLCFTIVALTGQAQVPVELKINPIGVIIGSPDLSLEIIASDFIGIEPKLGYNSFSFTVEDEDIAGRGINAGLWGKYYFLPTELNGGDGFYGGAYIRYANSKVTSSLTDETGKYQRAGIGLSAGYKWVANNYLTIEAGAGLGVAMVNKIEIADRTLNLQAIPFFGWFDMPLVLSIGYRFNNG